MRHRDANDLAVHEEMNAHILIAADEYRRRGLSVEDARRRAILESGGVEAAKEAYRDQRGIPVADALARDVRASFRSLRKSPGFTIAVVGTLALAIGATTVISSAVEAVMLRPIPVERLDRLVNVGRHDVAFDIHAGLNPAEVFALEKRHDLFDAVGGYERVDVNLTGTGSPQRVAAAATTGGFFDVFRVRPYLGRLYTSDDEQRGATSVAVLSFELWRDITGSDASAVGRTLRINDSSYKLVAVLPPGFAYPLGAQLWTPKALDPVLDRHGTALMRHSGAVVPTVARMRSGMTLPHLQGELTAAMRGWAEREPQYYVTRAPQPIEARGFVETSAGQLRAVLGVLGAAVAFVLVIACANVGSLQLLRTTGRAREIAVRMALGGSVGAIVRQFVVETLLLAAGGGLLGVAIAETLIAALGKVAAGEVPELHNLRLDPLVLGCSAAATVLAAVLFGIGPAVRAASGNPRDVLAAATARGHSSGRGRSRFLAGAVVVQIALALVLLLSCGTAVRSLLRLVAVDPGFDASGIVTARLVLPASRYPRTTVAEVERVMDFNANLLERIRALPGVDGASTIDVAPFGYDGVLDATLHRIAVAPSVGPDAGRNAVPANSWYVDKDYFQTMRIPLRGGVTFSGREQYDGVRAYPKVGQVSVVIDEALAHQLFPGESAVGKTIGAWSPGFKVIGVVGNVKKSDLSAGTDNAGALYLPNAGSLDAQTLMVRTRLPIANAAPLLRAAVRRLDPELPLFEIEPLAAKIQRSVGSRQIASWLLTVFAALAIFLALLGIYGVLSYAATQRTKEMGIRVALGATPREILRIVMGDGAILAGIGLMAGAVAYIALAREMSAVVYGVNGRDPRMIALATALLAASAVLATLPPAIRAARVNPVTALRAD